MSYVIDVYRREITPTRNLIQFAAFVSFFPAPGRRPDHAADDAAAAGRPAAAIRPRSSSTRAAYLIFWGLLKKVVIADNLAEHRQRPVRPLADARRRPGPAGGLCLRLPDLRRLLGLHRHRPGRRQVPGVRAGAQLQPPLLRHQPAGTSGPAGTSASRTWLRDYLYIPLGGSRGGTLRTYRNLMLTMILGGLWHGAAWTFVLWGIYQGLLLVGHRLAEPWLDRIDPTDPVDRACWKGLRIVGDLPHGLPRLAALPRPIGRAGRRHALGDRRTDRRSPRPPTSSRSLVLVIPLLLVQLIQYLADDLDVIARTPWYVRSALLHGLLLRHRARGRISAGSSSSISSSRPVLARETGGWRPLGSVHTRPRPRPGRILTSPSRVVPDHSIPPPAHRLGEMRDPGGTI